MMKKFTMENYNMRYIKYIKGNINSRVITRIKYFLDKDDSGDICDLIECIYYNEISSYVDEIINEKSIVDISNDQLKQLKGALTKKVNLFLNKLTIEYIEEFLMNSNIYDFDDLLLVLKKYKKLSIMDSNKLEHLLSSGILPYHFILNNSQFVRNNLDVIKQEFLKNDDLDKILIEADFKDKYTESIKLLSFEIDYYCELVENYIEKSTHLSSLLEVIFNKKGTLFSLPARVKLKAKKKYEEINEEFFKQLTHPPFQFGVKIKQEDTIDVPITYDFNNDNGHFLLMNFNKKNWDKDFDYLLNYFYYYCFYFDRFGILNISKKEKSTLARLFNENVSKIFKVDTTGRMHMMFDESFTRAIEDMLNLQEKSILNLVEYFLNTIMAEDFGIANFKYKVPETQNLYEKNRLLSLGLETLLKYYQYYVENGYIDSEEISMGYTLKKIECLSSQSNMYIALVDEKEKNEIMNMLFSDQSPLYIFYSNKNKADNFFELILNNNINVKHFDGYDYYLDKLVNSGFIKINHGIINVYERGLLLLLQQIYNETDINYYYLDKTLRDYADLLIERGYIYNYGGLFSKKEQDVVSYLFNNERFDNAIAIRNKYAHPHTFEDSDGDESYNDYILNLRLYMYILMKINDDCRISLYLKNEKFHK